MGAAPHLRPLAKGCQLLLVVSRMPRRLTTTHRPARSRPVDARSRRDRGTPRRALSCNASYTQATGTIVAHGYFLLTGRDLARHKANLWLHELKSSRADPFGLAFSPRTRERLLPLFFDPLFPLFDPLQGLTGVGCTSSSKSSQAALGALAAVAAGGTKACMEAVRV